MCIDRWFENAAAESTLEAMTKSIRGDDVGALIKLIVLTSPYLVPISLQSRPIRRHLASTISLSEAQLM